MMDQKSVSVPEDLSLRYRWCEGSVPPPDHYEYAIEIGPGGGRIEFCPDYPSEGVPVWEEEFEVSVGEIESLYRLVIASRILGEMWTAIEDPPVGGSLEWLEIVAQGKHIRVPSAIEESEKVREIYGAIRDLVPEDVWTGLMVKYGRYQERGGE